MSFTFKKTSCNILYAQPRVKPNCYVKCSMFLSCISTNDVNLYVHSIYEFSTTCAGSINNVLPFKSVELAQSYRFMSFAILTKMCINDTIDDVDLSESTSLTHLLDRHAGIMILMKQMLFNTLLIIVRLSLLIFSLKNQGYVYST